MSKLPYNFLKQRQLNISGLSRTNCDENSNRIKFDMKYQMKEFDRMAVLRYEVPKTWYLIDTDVDLNFSISENGGGDVNFTNNAWITGASTGGSHLILNNPTDSQFAKILQNVLDTSTAGYTVGLNSSNDKLHITHSSLTSLVIKTNSDILARYLGLSSLGVCKNKKANGGFKYSSGSLAISTPVLLPSAINLQRYDELFIRSGLAKNNWDQLVMTVNPHTGGTYGETISSETADVLGNSVAIDTASPAIEFTLHGDDGKLVPLHGHNFRLTVVCWKDANNSY